MIKSYFDLPTLVFEENQEQSTVTDLFMPDIEQYMEQVFYVLGSLFSVGKDYDFIKLAKVEAFVPLTPPAIGSEIMNRQFQQLQEELGTNLQFSAL